MSCQERFEDKYIPVTESGCWIWIGATYLNGYGQFFINKIVTGAHRAAWMLFKGEIPKGMRVCHTCDVPCCVNPAHLFLGTAKDNSQDMLGKDRHGRTSLSSLDVTNIRKIDNLSNAEIAKKYSVSTKVVYRIRNNETWSNL